MDEVPFTKVYVAGEIFQLHDVGIKRLVSLKVTVSLGQGVLLFEVNRATGAPT